MANQGHLKILRKGVEAWNAWRDKNPGFKPDLSRADLADADLHDANLSHANLLRADLCETYLGGANLYKANLTGANFYGAYLGGANLSAADLQDTDLYGTDLSGADLSKAVFLRTDLTNADLRSSNFSEAKMALTVFLGADLRLAKGLDTVKHYQVSAVAHSTLAESKGQILDVFLKGCGLQDWEIAAAKLHDPDLTSHQITDLVYEIDRIRGESPIKVNPLFISYSRSDSDFVDALETRLDAKHVRFWRDIHDMKAGPIEAQIERAIEVNRILLLVLSKNSVESDWVEYEVIRGRELEKERKEHVLCPIAIDDAWKTCSWDRRLRVQIEKYNILNFSEWQDDDAMGIAFQKLIDGLGLFYPKTS